MQSGCLKKLVMRISGTAKSYLLSEYVRVIFNEQQSLLWNLYDNTITDSSVFRIRNS